MSIRRFSFGQLSDGREVTCWELSRGAVTVRLIDYAAAVQSLIIPDRNGIGADVVLGYDTAEGYETDSSCHGAVVAPHANRIAGAEAVIGGRTYHLPVNDGENNLHTEKARGGHGRIWDAAAEEGPDTVDGADRVTFTLRFADGESGLPGNRTFSVTYALTKDALRLSYRGESDADTLMNPTNHTYFNLAGQGAGADALLAHTLRLCAHRFTAIRPGAIPTGELRGVSGTVFDFTAAKPIGRDIDADDEQLVMTTGYDHNFVIDGWTPEGMAKGELLPAAVAADPVSGRTLEVLTSVPGVQFYAGNHLRGASGKGGAVYAFRSGLALETQFFPDSIHHPEFPQCVYGPDRPYASETLWRFGCCE